MTTCDLSTTIAPTLSSLPFVVSGPGRPTQLWSVTRGGQWDEDCRRGREYAEALLVFMRATANPSVFGQVAKAIGASGQWTGVEVGFFQGIAEAATN